MSQSAYLNWDVGTLGCTQLEGWQGIVCSVSHHRGGGGGGEVSTL